jgi:hypothetical protein
VQAPFFCFATDAPFGRKIAVAILFQIGKAADCPGAARAQGGRSEAALNNRAMIFKQGQTKCSA